jgi:uncharacterized membrane protein
VGEQLSQRQHGGTVLRTNLSAEQEAKLRDALKTA